ncbi:MAG TPA: hypothetical protein VIM16_01580 [Mucilaginibacter sp.]
MKKRFFAFALIIAAFVSVTSGCYVGYGYEHRYHHDRDHRDRDYHDHDRGDYHGDDRGYR